MSTRLRFSPNSQNTLPLIARSSLQILSTFLLPRLRTLERMSLPMEVKSSLVRTIWLLLLLRSLPVIDLKINNSKSSLTNMKLNQNQLNLSHMSLERLVSSSLRLTTSILRKKLRLRLSKCQPRLESKLHATSGLNA